ncbi:hypothetical protein [Flavobacterium wongokense]|uniref:hypothetical protein n=1 Tax=Flavobacterium wongokense TaxID=2910674 RepID=UPI001F3615D0|nr:hypothetical protein [Flavobacterium sp. WG47]MCF6130983.1 hypothetical protein [Flavobacterium sp. WG47]
MKLLLKGTLIASAFLLFSCSSSDDSGATGECESDIAFLQTGKYLKYSMDQFGTPIGGMKLEFGGCDGNGVFSLTRRYYNTSNAETGSQIDKLKNEAGYMAIDVANTTEVFWERLFKKNAQLNDTWNDTKADGTVYTREVIDVDSLITVPAGTFHCKVYKQYSSNSIGDNYIFWNDEVGEVMEESIFLTMKLTEHN